ncbi:MAG: class F sortase [Sporichthyaceae bacterium]
MKRHRGHGALRAVVAVASVAALVAGVGQPSARADLIPPIPGLPPLPPPLGPKPEEPKPRCSTARQPFVPTSVGVSDVGTVQVVAMNRGRDGIPGSPPTNNRGRGQMAFDLDSGIRPGDERGNALLNAHTFPDGRALGNALLAELQEGDRVVVHGKGGKFCYRVTDRVEVHESDRSARTRYYDRKGSPQIAIVVCSGKRLGPGNWTHRTMWFAKPVR